MRVTGNQFSNAFINQLNTLAGRQQRLQAEAATGQRISAPADDPAAVQRTLQLQAQQKVNQQFGRNIAALQERASAVFGGLKAVKSISDRAGEIATLADGTKPPEQLRIYAAQVTELIKQAVHVMNSRQGTSHLFGGTQNGQPPFVLATDADGNVTGVTYQGNTDVPEKEIESGVTIEVDVPGVNTTGAGPRGVVADSRSGADFFNHLISLQNHLLAGDTNAIAATDLPALQQDEDNILYHITSNGAVQTRLETAVNLTGDRAQSLLRQVSDEADADITETLVNLNQAQYAYQAALQSGAGIMQVSLLNFLR